MRRTVKGEPNPEEYNRKQVQLVGLCKFLALKYAETKAGQGKHVDKVKMAET
jgi:hypothetical protein